MKIFQGARLTRISISLAAVSFAGAVGLAASGNVRLPAADVAARGGEAIPDRSAVTARVAMARAAESAGDVAAALARYREAAILDPRIVDPRSPEFLGPSFEGQLKRWIAELKAGRAQGGGKALSDASFLFRRMYGGCG